MGPVRFSCTTTCISEFKVSEKLKNEIKVARSEFKALCDRLDFGTMEYKHMNRGFIRKQKLSPDALIQLAIQVLNLWCNPLVRFQWILFNRWDSTDSMERPSALMSPAVLRLTDTDGQKWWGPPLRTQRDVFRPSFLRRSPRRIIWGN